MALRTLLLPWKPLVGKELKKLRISLGLSQPKFAHRYGFNLASLRKWEQGNAIPEQVTAMFLLCIKQDPEGIARAVAKLRANPKNFL